MTPQPPVEVTQLLAAIRKGDTRARERLFALLYQELRRIAAGLMRAERANHTLQPSALVNEAVVRLLEQGALAKAVNRRYFFDTATKVMRQILVDHARARSAGKRGAHWRRKSLDAVVVYFEERNLDVCALDQALQDLALVNQRQSQVVTLRVFLDLTWADVARQLDVSEFTVKRDFRFARAWLHERLDGEIDDT
jgi:RNA polymerase sigma factor (TIGR02999 family)